MVHAGQMAHNRTVPSAENTRMEKSSRRFHTQFTTLQHPKSTRENMKEEKTSYNYFDLEQAILSVWQTKDDLEAIAENEMSALLSGMAQLHDTRCKKLMKVFEHILEKESRTSPELPEAEIAGAADWHGDYYASQPIPNTPKNEPLLSDKNQLEEGEYRRHHEKFDNDDAELD